LQRNILIIFCLFNVLNINSQSIRDYNLEVSCKSRVHTPVLSILDFKWRNPPPTATGQRVYRKLKEAYAWGAIYKNLNNNDTTFSDTIATGSHFEYRFEKDTGHDGYSVQGYIYAGHRVLPITQRGTILLIIDSTHKDFLFNNIRTFRNDLIGDGWFTKIFWISPSTTVSTIKSYILSEYAANPSQVKSVCLIGDVAVPYSGDYSAFGITPPDGHTVFGPPSHEGAWPADLYYGDMDEASWTDVSVTNNSGARVENRNNPGDGKFDQTTIPTLIELQVGRIDLSNMSSFAESEQELLRRYFIKNHQYKHNQFNVVERCLIDNHLPVIINYPSPYFDEHFTGNAYRNMAPLISDTVCYNLDYLTNLTSSNSYQWSFGFGAGSYTNASGVATTDQMANPLTDLKTVFTGLFGSFFGDWDNSNNFLRAPLGAKGHTLNSFWVGRPHWFFHHMGLGENIGYSTLRTQNNYNTSTLNLLYPTTSYGYLQVHVALMGDPTTRTQVVSPITDLSLKQDSCNNRFILKWTKSTDTAVHQYFVFRANHIDSLFTQIGVATDTNFYIDNSPISGNNIYMVRSLKLQESGSGSYFNLSQGVFDTISFTIPTAYAGKDTSICSNSLLSLGTNNHDNSINTIYNWQIGNFNTDTLTFNATNSESKILTVSDTLTGCVLRDTVQITVLPLPLPETVTAIGSLCNDTITWSCTSNNIVAHNYNWLFSGAQPNDTNGNMLINPGSVVYPSIGSYDMILTITNNVNSCQLLDTITQIISCLGLSIQNNRLINCTSNTIVIKLNEELINSYSELIFKGYRKNQWERLSSFNILEPDNLYYQQKSQLYSKYSIYGVNKNNSKEEFIGDCNSNFNSNEFVISPIPMIDFINIFTEDIRFFNQFCDIDLVNIHGKTIKEFNDILLNDNTRLNLEDLSNGVYFMKLTINNQTFVFKIVK
jgi:hypothetical protein